MVPESKNDKQHSVVDALGRRIEMTEENAYFFRKSAEQQDSELASFIKPHRCATRLTDVVDAFYGNIKSDRNSSVRHRIGIMWNCFRSSPGNEPLDDFYNPANEKDMLGRSMTHKTK